MELSKKVSYLQKLCNKFGDFELQIIKKDDEGNTFASKRMSMLKLWSSDDFMKINNIEEFANTKTGQFLMNANQRTKLKNEIILDFDEGTKKQIYNMAMKAYDIFKDNANKIGIFETNRGYHVHIIVTDEIYQNKKLLEMLFKILGADLNLLHDKHMIALEFEKHWKSGKEKKLVYGDWYFKEIFV